MKRPIRTLIVDDERLARKRLRELVGAHEDIVIAGEATTGPEAVEAIETLAPDVLLLDIALPRMSGFEVLACIEGSLPIVIFTTAYDEHAIRAFEIHAADYLMKPVERDRLATALDRARERLERKRQGETDEPLRVIASSLAPFSRVVVRTGRKIFFLNPDDIDAIEAVGNYSRIRAGTEKYLTRHTLAALEERLSPHGFARIQRSVLVNAQRVAELQRQTRGSYIVVLTSGVRLALSPRYRENLARLLGDF